MARNKTRRALRAAGVAAGMTLGFGVAHADTELTRMQNLLAATPAGGWVQANIGKYSSAFATGSDAIPEAVLGSWSHPRSVVNAWSSLAWDSKRGDLLIWGGGHANYAGNEMYVWDGASGNWQRGSLPSRLDTSTPDYFVVDHAAPQSAHTYENNVYLTVNDRFLTFGGATFQTGGNFVINPGGVVQRAGPWLWDPAKADPNKVGGTTGSGWNSETAGGQMWTNRQGQWTGTEGPAYVFGTTATTVINGRDVVYVTADSQSSGYPNLYRYTLGNVSAGELDRWDVVGATVNTAGYLGAATLDTARNLYVRTAISAHGADLAVWNLNAYNGAPVWDQAITLTTPDGGAFSTDNSFGIDYDAANDQYVLWDGADRGKVWYTKAQRDAGGNLLSTWTVYGVDSTTDAEPIGNFGAGVLGKWDYVSELGAFVALEQYNEATMDAAVWLYKPLATVPLPVPEPAAALLMLLGLGGMALRLRSGPRPD